MATPSICEFCQQAITTEKFIRVGKLSFHQNHFTCAECKKDLRDQKFHKREDDGKFYCFKDYTEKFSHTCQHCRQKILPSSPFLPALGGYYHPEHFVCATCEKPFEGKFFPKDNRPYCEEHFYLLSAKKCSYCQEPVTEKQDKLTLGSKVYHGKCIFCFHCNIPLSGKSDKMKKDDRIYCREHLLDLFCKVCTACGKHIVDQCIGVNSEHYHPDCLRCSAPDCNKIMDNYICVSGYLRCSDHQEIECPTISCSICKKNVYGEVVRSCGMRVHEDCFKCGFCDKKLDKATTKIKKDRFCCEACIQKKNLVALPPPKRTEAPEPEVKATPTTITQKTQKIDIDDPFSIEGELEVPTDPLPDPPTDSSEPGEPTAETTETETGSGPTERKKKDPPEVKEKEFKDEPIAWRKGGMIGQGAFGKVYEALNTKTGELLAVKQVTIDESSPGAIEAMQEIQNEIMLMKKLQHRNIVTLLGTERSGGTLSILMEFVPGKSLDSILSKYGALDETVIRNYTKQILSALEYCHNKRVVHRDIKGKNILVDKTGCLKLADFGSAKAFQSNKEKVAPGHTYNYTPLWTAPEVLVGDYSSKVDIWSLGCVIIEMASAKPPWSEQNFENPFRALYHIGNSTAIPKVPDNLSEDALSFVNLCLQRDPDKRASATELLKHKWVEGEKDR